MALRFSGADPFLRTSIGALSGYGIRNNPVSAATMLKRNAIGAWHGIHCIDDGSTGNQFYAGEFNPGNNMIEQINPSEGGRTTTAAITDTTNFIVLGWTWDGTTTASKFVFRYRIGSGAWVADPKTSVTDTPTLGSGYRHLIGNEAALGDDASFDWVCSGMIKSELSQAVFESLDMSSIASWDAVFTGANAWLVDGRDIGTRVDRTGNGGNEVSRSGGLTLVADPAGFSWSPPGVIPDYSMFPKYPLRREAA